MANPNIAEVTPAAPLEITITPRQRVPVFRPEGEDNLGAGEGENVGDQFLRLTQQQQGRAARDVLDRLSIEGAPKAAATAVGTAVAASQDTAPAEGGPTETAGRSFGESVGAVAKDVGRGLTQTPRAIVQGAGEAVRQVATAGASLSEWLGKNTGGVLGTTLDEYRTLLKADPKTAPDAALPDEELWKRINAKGEEILKRVVPTLGEKPDTVTAGLVHDVSQFLTGMAIGGKLLEGAGIVLTGFGKVAARGAFSDFAARDPDAAKLADLASKYPGLHKPLTDLLAAQPDDKEVVKRLKAAAEGLGLGVLSEGFVRGAIAVRSRMQAGNAVSQHGQMLKTMEEDAVARYGRLSEEAMALLGDPKAPLVKAVTPGQKASIAAKKIEAGARDMGVDISPSDAMKQAWRESSPAKTVDDLFKNAAKNNADLGNAGKEISKETGAEFKHGPIKKRARVLEKMEKDGKKPGAINDVVRGGFVADTPAQADGIVASLAKRFEIIDEGWAVTPVGYFDRKVLVRFKDGATGEIQIWHPDMKLASGGEGHKLYTKWREASPGSPEKDALERKMRSLYGSILDGLAPEWKALAGKVGREGNLAAKSDLDKIRADMPIDAESTGRQAPSRTAQASPGDQRTGSPSSEANVTFGSEATGTSTPNIGTPGGVVKGGEVPVEQLAAGLVKTTDAGGNDIYVNFARIEGTEDVKKTIGLMADAGKAKIDAKRGGEKVTFGRMEELAADLGMDVTDLLARRSGTPMSAAEALAARSLLTASAERLTDLAKSIASGTGTKTEEFLFRRQMAIHAAIQAEVIAARTETARALASWNIPRGGNIEASRHIFDALEAMGGSATTQELAKRLSILQAARPNNLGSMADFVRKSVTARTIDAAMEAWKSAMLSGPTTHLSNIFSNALTMGVMTVERKIGEMISRFRGTPEGVAAGEANAMAHGLVESSKDAFRLAWMALKTGEGQFGRASGKADLTPQRAISREALGLPDNVWGNSVDYIGKGFNIPFRFLTAEDEFFKTMTFRMELHAQAQRVAQNEGLTGAAAAARMRQVIDNPPEVVKLAATDFALAATYNRELTGALAKVAQARGDDGAFGRAMQFVLPFFRTPVNVFAASVERSPLAFLTQQFRADIKAGGARQDLALARMATGTTIMLVAADLADQGLVTGMISKDPAKKEASERQGIPPYSVKIGDKWLSYNRLDPLAMPVAIAANMAELAKRFEVEPDKLDSVREVMAAAIGGTAQAALNRSFMQGTAGLISAIADPEQHADAYMKSTLAGFFTPAISATVAQLADPTKRETFDAIDAIEARIVEVSKTLIPRMDLWGRDIRLAESGAGRVFDVISPMKIETERPNPIDTELQRLNFFPKRIDKRGSWDGAPVEFSKFPEVYAEYARLAGNGLKSPQYEGKGAMDFLNDLVEGKSGYDAYWRILSDGAEGGKAQFIQKVITDFRKEARREIEADPRYTEFRQYLAKQATAAAVKKAPTEPQRQVAPMIPRGATIQ